jgi:hypothetical protein
VLSAVSVWSATDLSFKAGESVIPEGAALELRYAYTRSKTPKRERATEATKVAVVQAALVSTTFAATAPPPAMHPMPETVEMMVEVLIF